MDRVNNGEFYAAIIVQPGATNAFTSALLNNTPYDPSQATIISYDQARGGPNIATILGTYLPALIQGASTYISRVLIQQGQVKMLPHSRLHSVAGAVAGGGSPGLERAHCLWARGWPTAELVADAPSLYTLIALVSLHSSADSISRLSTRS